MQNPLSANERRETAHLEYVACTLDVLARPDVEESLGGFALELYEKVENSFAIPRRDGCIVLPEDQCDTDNIGVHPVMRTERRMPSCAVIDWLRADDRQRMEQRFPAQWEEYVQSQRARAEANVQATRLPRRPLAYGVQDEAMVVTTPNNEQVLLRSRGFVVVNHGNARKLSSLALAAVMGDEFDHAMRTNFDMGDAKAYQDLYADPESVTAASVRNERFAYKVSRDITAVLPDSTELHQYLETALRGHGPQEAGLMVVRMARTRHESTLPRKWRGNEHRLYAGSAGALLLSEMFGDGSSEVTRDEVAAYEAAGLVNGF